MTKSELSKFFSEGKKKVEETMSERISNMSKGSKFKGGLSNRLAEKAQ